MKAYYFIPAVAIASIILSGCGQEQSSSQNELTSPVSVREVQKNSIRKYNSTTGTVLSNSEVELKSEMAGFYKLQINPRTKQPYKLGDKVNADEVIVRLEGKEYELSVSLESKRLNKDIAAQELIKQKALYEKGGVTLSDLRNSEVKVINADESYESALIQMEKMNVKAPFSGVIVNLPHYTSSAKIESGSSLVSIMDYSKMYMEINLPESAISEVIPGQEVFITHYTLKKDTVLGSISQISPAISSETRTFKGKLLVNNEELKLHPGMFVKADIVVDKSDSTIVIPKEIVMNNRKQKYVFIAEKGVAKMCNIQTGLEDKDNIEVLDGLKLEDQLITRGYETLRDNSKIKIQK